MFINRQGMKYYTKIWNGPFDIYEAFVHTMVFIYHQGKLSGVVRIGIQAMKGGMVTN